MAIKFSWEYFWSYYQRVNYPRVQEKMRQEVLADNWLFDQPAEAQIEVLKHAPADFVEGIKAQLKPEAAKTLKPDLIDWSKL